MHSCEEARAAMKESHSDVAAPLLSRPAGQTWYVLYSMQEEVHQDHTHASTARVTKSSTKTRFHAADAIRKHVACSTLCNDDSEMTAVGVCTEPLATTSDQGRSACSILLFFSTWLHAYAKALTRCLMLRLQTL